MISPRCKVIDWSRHAVNAARGAFELAWCGLAKCSPRWQRTCLRGGLRVTAIFIAPLIWVCAATRRCVVFLNDYATVLYE